MNGEENIENTPFRQLSYHRPQVSATETDFEKFEIAPDLQDMMEEDPEFLDALMEINESQDDPESIVLQEAEIVHLQHEHDHEIQQQNHFLENHLHPPHEIEDMEGASFDLNSIASENSFMDHSYIDLQNMDVVCAGHDVRHPGNVTIRRIVRARVINYGAATTGPAREEVIGNILGEMEATHQSSRFLIRDETVLRQATHDEIYAEIRHQLHLYFNIIPNARDAIFGRGNPFVMWPGTISMRNHAIAQRPAYAQATTNIARRQIVQKVQDFVVQGGGRFLMPFHESEPGEGCIEAEDTYIKKKIQHILRNSKGKSKKGESEASSDHDHSQNIPTVHADSFNQPVVHLVQADIVPSTDFDEMEGGNEKADLMITDMASFSSSSYSEKNNTSTVTSQQVEKLPTSVQVENDQPSLASTLDGHRKPNIGIQNYNPDVEQPTLSSTISGDGSAEKEKKTISRWRYVLTAAFLLIILGIIIMFVLRKDDKKSSAEKLNTFSQPSFEDASKTISNIVQKGEIVCGITQQDGYAAINDQGNWEGFDIDLCRAVAAGIFGKDQFDGRGSEPVKFVNLDATERFISLDNGEVDLLMAITSQTMERAVYEPSTQKGYTFSKPYLVNGLTFGGNPTYLPCLDANSTFAERCQNAKLCILNGTTHVDIMSREFADFQGNIVTPLTLESFYSLFKSGSCNLLAGEQFDIAEIILVQQGYIGEYELRPGSVSKELISMVTRDHDARFSDFVNWILQALTAAEEMRLMRNSQVTFGALDSTSVFGSRFEFMFQDAVAVAGDYGALYSKHLQRIVPREATNNINQGEAGIYARPFGEVQLNPDPEIEESPTLDRIRSRGKLRCGITESPIFAELVDNEWTGLDVDFCRAIAAAIFDGIDKVDFQVLTAVDRFQSLLNGEVDLLARVTTLTLPRDVLEPTTGRGFTFSPANFHDEIRFVGKGQYRQCAESRDYNSESCKELYVCVTEATTNFNVVSKMFPPSRLRVLGSTSETVESFGKGDCNAFAGGAVERSPASIRRFYSGEYSVGETRFSRESLALVTNEDDVVWSKFVEWIVIATFWAEEHGITQATYLDMPRVNLFRSRTSKISDLMFRNAIAAVGSYAEIWERNAGGIGGVEREGRNLLNRYPLGPLLISDLVWSLVNF